MRFFHNSAHFSNCSTNYIGAIPVLVEAVKEQQKQIEDLKKLNGRIANVEAENASLKAQMKRLDVLENQFASLSARMTSQTARIASK